MTPKPPPGFEIIPDGYLAMVPSAPLGAATPPPPPGFQIIQEAPPIDWLAPGQKDKIATMPEDERESAWNQWADAVVAKERDSAGALAQLPHPARGIPIVGGLLDEATAYIQSGLHKVTGGRLGENYDEALALERARQRQAAEASPVLDIAGQIGAGIVAAPALPLWQGATTLQNIGRGAVTAAGYGGAHGYATGEGGAANRAENAGYGAAGSAVLGAAVPVAVSGVQAVRRAMANQGQAGAYGAIADDLEGGVDAFADQVSAGASRANLGTNRRTLDILGDEMERAGGNVQQAQQATINRIVQELGVTPQTAARHIRQLANVHEDSQLMLGEYPSVSASDAAQRLRRPGNVDLDELGRVESTNTQGKIDYLANNGNAQSAHNVRNAVALRQEQLAPAMRGSLDDMAPQIPVGPRTNRPATIEDTADLVDTATRLARQEYDVAYNSPVARPQRLQQLPRFFEYLANRASTSAPEVAATIRNAVNQIAVRMPDGSLGTQSLRQLQQGRTTLRGQITNLVQNGRADLANEIRPLYRLTTRVMEEMSPSWAVANRRWADMNLAEVAQDLGDAFTKKAGPRFREQVAQFDGLAPEAQDIVRIHVVQKLQDEIDNLGDSHAVSKLFSSDAARNLIRRLFGDEAAVSFTRAVRDQKVAEGSQRMLANSATHRRGVAQKQADAETGLVSAVENANARGVRNWLLERATQLLTERKNRPMSGILTTPMSDTAAVARHIHNMRNQQQRLQQIGTGNGAPIAPSLSAVTGQNWDKEQRKDGGRVMDDEDLPRLPSDPWLMGSAAETANWGEPPVEPKNRPKPFSRAVGYTDPQDKKAQADDAVGFWKGTGAGIADLGGATSKGARAAGLSGLAETLEKPQQESPEGAFAGSLSPGSLIGAGWDVVQDAYDAWNTPSAPPIKAIDRDTFFKERRKPRESLEEAAARAEREFRASPAYMDLNKRNMVKVANRELGNAVERAKQTWRESQGNLGGEEKAIEADYRAHLADVNKQLEAENAKGFSERNAWFKPAFGAATLAAGGLGALGMRSINKKARGLLDAHTAAVKTMDADAIWESKEALRLFQEGLPRSVALKVGLPATLPMDVRGFGHSFDAALLPDTYADAEGNRQPVMAKEKAWEHIPHNFETIPNFVAENIPALLSGSIAAGLGATKFGGTMPKEKIGAVLSKRPPNALDDIAGAEAANASASGKIAQARRELADARETAASESRLHAQRLARSEATPPRSSRRADPVDANTPGPSSTTQGPGQVQGGGTTKALPSPRAASEATKNKFWDDVEAALGSGRDPSSLKASDYPGMSDDMIKGRLARVKGLQGKKTPLAMSKLLKQIRANDSWKLGVAGTAAAGAGAASIDKDTD